MQTSSIPAALPNTTLPTGTYPGTLSGWTLTIDGTPGVEHEMQAWGIRGTGECSITAVGGVIVNVAMTTVR